MFMLFLAGVARQVSADPAVGVYAEPKTAAAEASLRKKKFHCIANEPADIGIAVPGYI